MKWIRTACAAGYERMAARGPLLDRINVFPVADADTGVNLRLSLAPLRNLDSTHAVCLAQLQRCATGNSGNIAAAFFSPLLNLPIQQGSKTAEQHLIRSLALGSELAHQAVLTPKQGTMLDVLATLAAFHHQGAPLPSGRDLLDRLAATVAATTKLLPELRQAGVVDAGALGLFFFFEGFFATWLQEPDLPQPAQKLFPGQLDPTFSSGQKDTEQAMCINLALHRGTSSTTTQTDLNHHLENLGKSVVARQEGNTLHLHLHSHTPEVLRQEVQRFGTITAWRAEAIQIPAQTKPLTEPGLLHLLCDAAGSLPRPLAQEQGITLLDSYVICEGESRPESLWDKDYIYTALRQGKKVGTAQASIFERQQHYASAIEFHGLSLYLAVGSAYTGNHATAQAWKTHHAQQDMADNFIVVDSGAASGRLACIALLAAAANRKAQTKEELLACIARLCQDCEEYIFIDQLRYLAAGGRISKISGFAGGLLGLKPIISPQPEGVRKIGVVRSQAAQIDFALNQMRSLIQKAAVPLALLQFSDNEVWLQQEVLPLLRELLPGTEILLLPLSLTSGVHMGPGTWALAACPLTKECEEV
ncbi:MAG: DegV family EDD domain-containing protein [Desulfobulbaceae bacterium]|nr:DegV family EDD domain-containing protein [Desulfobulbaceae bacterium]